MKTRTRFVLIALATGVADLLGWPAWSGFLLVAVLLGTGGFIAYSAASRSLRQVHPVPRETVATLKENSAWIAKRLSSGQK